MKNQYKAGSMRGDTHWNYEKLLEREAFFNGALEFSSLSIQSKNYVMKVKDYLLSLHCNQSFLILTCGVGDPRLPDDYEYVIHNTAPVHKSIRNVTIPSQSQEDNIEIVRTINTDPPVTIRTIEDDPKSEQILRERKRIKDYRKNRKLVGRYRRMVNKRNKESFERYKYSLMLEEASKAGIKIKETSKIDFVECDILLNKIDIRLEKREKRLADMRNKNMNPGRIHKYRMDTKYIERKFYERKKDLEEVWTLVNEKGYS